MVLMVELLGSTVILICTVSLFFASLLLLLRLVKERGKKEKLPKLPPGPPKLPIIGNMKQLLGQQPHRILRDLSQKYGPLMHLQLGQVPTIVVSSPRIAEEIMKTHDLTFASRPELIPAKIIAYGSKDVGFAPYGAYWRQMRKICILELLSTKRVQSFRLVREDEVSLLIQSIMLASPGPVNLTKKLSSLSNDITARATFGRKYGDNKWPGFEAAVKKVSELAAGFHVGDFFPSLKFVTVLSGMKFILERNHLEFDQILSEIIEEHKQRSERDGELGHEDLVDVLLRLQKNNSLDIPLTNESMKAVILDMFLGGTETSATTMDWAMAEMMRNPKVMERAQREVREVVGGKGMVEENDIHKLSYLTSVLKETLRMHPPLPLLIPRESIERCTIDGYEIPSKTRVIVNSWAINRNLQSWENAETFNPERFSGSSIDFNGHNFEFIPFGGGRRGCPGISFGVAIIQLALANLLYYFDWKLPNEMKPEEFNMNEVFGITMPRKSSLILIPIPRFPLLNHRTSM